MSDVNMTPEVAASPYADILKDMTGWEPIETAPKDGTLILLTWEDGGRPAEIWPMQWGHIQRNGFFPGDVGMWVAPDGSCTWNATDPEGAPTHWRPTLSLRSASGMGNETQEVSENSSFAVSDGPRDF